MKYWTVLLMLAMAAAGAPQLEGDWSATLSAGGNQLRLLLHVTRSGEQWTATVDSLDQGATGLAVDQIEMNGGKLKFSMQAIEASYEGIWDDGSSEFRGNWRQAGNTLPLNWKRDASRARASTPISDADRQFLLEHLAKSSRAFYAAIAGVTPQQWNYKEADRWSIAECAEHIIAADGIILGFVRSRVLLIPSTGAVPSNREQDEKVLALTLDRSRRGKAPEVLQPKNGVSDPADAAAKFKQARAGTVEYIQSTQDDLRSHATPHAVLKSMDAYQYLLMLSAHTLRHVAQIEDVKNEPGYPR